MRRLLASLMVLGLFTATAALTQSERAYAQKDKKADKKEEMKKDDGLKDQWPKVTDGVVVKIVKVDVEKKTVDVESGDGKKMSLSVTADTKFFGPQGGRSDEKIKDDRFAPPYTAKILTDKAGKTLTEVYLAYRIKKDKEDAKKEEMKEDPKKKDDKKVDDKKKDEKKKPA